MAASLHTFIDVLKLLPLPMVRVLGLKEDSAILVGTHGLRTSDGLRFDVLNASTVDDYFKGQNFNFLTPILVRKDGAEKLGVTNPGETVLDMKITTDGADPSLAYPIYQTTVSYHSTLNSTWTIRQMMEYFKGPVSSREQPLALFNAPLTFCPKGFEYHIPSVLSNADVLSPVMTHPSGFVDLSKGVSMIANGSVRRLHCNKDGAVTYMSPVHGSLLVFFLLKPTDKDYSVLLKCSNPMYNTSYAPAQMEGTMACTLLRKGELLMFSGSLPHGLIALEDTLIMGGKIIIPSSIPRLIKFGEETKRKSCAGVGYEFNHLKQIMYQGCGKIFKVMWDQRCSGFKSAHNYNVHVLTKLQSFFEERKKELQINEKSWEHLKAFFSLIPDKIAPMRRQHKSGVFYRTSSADRIEPMLDSVFGCGMYFPAVFNVLGSGITRMVFPVSPDHLDSCSEFENKSLREDNLFFETRDYYERFVGGCPLAVLHDSRGRIGVFAYSDIAKDGAVVEFTGILRTIKEQETIYGNRYAVGRTYFLKLKLTRGELPREVVVDSNAYGGYSLFLSVSDDPNCSIVNASVDGRMVLLVKANRDIDEGEELSIPPPKNSKPVTSISDFIYGRCLPTSNAIVPYGQDRQGIGEDNINPPVLPITDTNHPGSSSNLDTNKPGPLISQDIRRLSPPPPFLESQSFIKEGNAPGPSSKEDKTTKQSKTLRGVAPCSLVNSATEIASEPTIDNEDLGADYIDQPEEPNRPTLPPVVGRRIIRLNRPPTSPPSPDSDDDSKDDYVYNAPDADGWVPRIHGRVRRQYFMDRLWPNDQNEGALFDLLPTERRALRHFNPTNYHEEWSEFQRVNNELLEMYDRARRKNACALCAHYGRSMEKHSHHPFHPLLNKGKLKLHWKRHHQKPIHCDVCKKLQLGLKGVNVHKRRMRERGEAKHIAAYEAKKAAAVSQPNRKRKFQDANEEESEHDSQDESRQESESESGQDSWEESGVESEVESDDEPHPTTSTATPRKRARRRRGQ